MSNSPATPCFGNPAELLNWPLLEIHESRVKAFKGNFNEMSRLSSCRLAPQSHACYSARSPSELFLPLHNTYTEAHCYAFWNSSRWRRHATFISWILRQMHTWTQLGNPQWKVRSKSLVIQHLPSLFKVKYIFRNDPYEPDPQFRVYWSVGRRRDQVRGRGPVSAAQAHWDDRTRVHAVV